MSNYFRTLIEIEGLGWISIAEGTYPDARDNHYLVVSFDDTTVPANISFTINEHTLRLLESAAFPFIPEMLRFGTYSKAVDPITFSFKSELSAYISVYGGSGFSVQLEDSTHRLLRRSLLFEFREKTGGGKAFILTKDIFFELVKLLGSVKEREDMQRYLEEKSYADRKATFDE